MSRLRKGDLVAVLTGKDRGKHGKILRMLSQRRSALVERLNLMKHFDRPTQANQAGGIIEREAPILVDKLALVCPRCNRPTRIGMTVNGSGRQRTCRRCKEPIGG